MNRYLILIVTILATTAASAQVKEFGWLLGTWKLKEKNVLEIWLLAKDKKTLKGFSCKVNGADTVTMEKMSLTQDGGGGFHYIADVAENTAPVDFQIHKHEVSSFVAENPTHDFPKIIRYQLVRRENKDFIEAAIEGNGKVIPYHFERVR